jgi:hypothetical protein
MKSIQIAGASLAIILGLTACGTGGKVSSAPATSAPASSAAAASAPDATTEPTSTEQELQQAQTPEPEPTPTETGPAKFGQSFSYDDGMTISVAPPKSGQATETAAGATETAGEIMILTVTITNGTKKVFDPSVVSADLNYGPDGTAAQRVFDSAQNLGSGFEGKILPGKKQVAKLAFGVPAHPGEVLVSIAPSFSHTDALFSGTVK